MSVSAGIALAIRLLALSATIRHALADREERFTSVTSTRTLTITVFPTAVDSPTASLPTSASISTSTPNMSKSSFQDEVLNSTNYYRKQFQVEPVTWNDTLADFADDYVKGCIWKHSVSFVHANCLPQLALTVSKGRSIRRKPRFRLRNHSISHRRLGRRRASLQLGKTEVLGRRWPFYTTGLEQHYDRGLWSSQLHGGGKGKRARPISDLRVLAEGKWY